MAQPNRTIYLGVDPTAGRRPYTYAALDADCRLIAIGEGPAEDVFSFAAGQSAALAAVNAPRRPSLGLLERAEVRSRFNPPPQPGRWVDTRVAEYELRRQGIPVIPTPRREEDCPGWVRGGFELYRRLDGCGYQAYPVEGAELQSLEVNPHAAFTFLLGQAPFPKETLEGRLQRQLALYERDVQIRDPMLFFEEVTRHKLLHGVLPLKDIHTPGELDALVAAFLAWLAGTRPQEICLLGDREEGQVIVPRQKTESAPPTSSPAAGRRLVHGQS